MRLVRRRALSRSDIADTPISAKIFLQLQALQLELLELRWLRGT